VTCNFKEPTNCRHPIDNIRIGGHAVGGGGVSGSGGVGGSREEWKRGNEAFSTSLYSKVNMYTCVCVLLKSVENKKKFIQKEHVVSVFCVVEIYISVCVCVCVSVCVRVYFIIVLYLFVCLCARACVCACACIYVLASVSV